ncbi:hypothetical protein MKUB_43720 [Mycobacterium kubicae]|uniref:Transposase IS30-like HTH domain-containing protein n=1 Tax=Mycobacterium kubicae TaxID=120959 RepID=A0ABQ1BT16_9MYCO|nr:helix-turn-helix domain-containing protein [Mycobacterium kubicae]GFG66882.1 hypothetical protein MKUB_43720 [Mycobacterium kubicae]
MNPQLQAPQGRKRPRLSPEEREQIMIGTSRGESIRLIAHRLKRAPSTVMREIDRNGAARGLTGRYRAKYRFGARQCGWDATSGYSARIAQRRSEERARRPKAGKLTRCPQLAGKVQALLTKKYSPEQIAGELAKTYPDSPEMHVSHETIYRALYVQGRGELRRDLVTCLRTGARCVDPVRELAQEMVAAAFRAWSTSASAPPRPPTAPYLGIGRETSCATRRCVTERR